MGEEHSMKKLLCLAAVIVLVPIGASGCMTKETSLNSEGTYSTGAAQGDPSSIQWEGNPYEDVILEQQ